VPDSWTLTVFVADDGTIPYGRFRDRLDPVHRDALDTAAEVVLAARGIDLVRTEWMKALGDGLHEFRIRHSAAETARMFRGEPDLDERISARILLRVFMHFHGQQVVLLLGGYDKGADPSKRRQQREIAAARKLLQQFQDRQRRERRQERRRPR
jgi:hypothetical protein